MSPAEPAKGKEKKGKGPKGCASITQAGKRCRVPALKDSDYCMVHDPRDKSKKARERARSKGGKQKDKKVKEGLIMHDHATFFARLDPELHPWKDFETPRDVVRGLRFLAGEMFDRRIDSKLGNALAQVLNTLLSGFSKVAGILETEDEMPPMLTATGTVLDISPRNAAVALRAFRDAGFLDSEAQLVPEERRLPEGQPGAPEGDPPGSFTF